MKLKNHFPVIVVVALAVASCIQPEQPSSEADIINFNLENDTLVAMPDINPNEVVLKLSKRDWDRLVNANETFIPNIQISPGATIMPPSGVAVTLNTAHYTVTAEDGITQKKYTIAAVKPYDEDTLHFSFDEWKVKAGAGYDYLVDQNWSNGNPGVSMGLQLLGDSAIPSNYPTQATDDAVSGKAVRLETKKGGVVMTMQVPVWAGNFFLGNFNTSKVMDPRRATEFGRSVTRKPKSMHGYYKYHEGPGKYNDHTDLIDRHDSCSLYAVFYQADDIYGKEVTLTAYDISTSNYVVARAEIPDGSTTAGDGFHKFDIDFVYRDKPIDFSKHRYKLAIVFSSSSVGATVRDGKTIYAGKVGSVLVVDEVTLVNF